MSDTATATSTAKPSDDGPPPPLTVAEILAFKAPPNLSGWRLAADVNGGYSFRATIGDIDYIATPHTWAGRTLTTNTGGSSMGSFATNGVMGLNTQMPGTMATNDPNMNRALVPIDATETSTSTVQPDVTEQQTGVDPTTFIGIALLAAVVVAIVAGSLAYVAGRRSNAS
jgi:hypothetical protein